MARFREIFSSFISGEITPKSWGRADLPQYKQACEELTNMLVFVQGGVGKRPGTEFISDNETFNEYDPGDVIRQGVRLVPFIISRTEAYVIIFDCIIRTFGHPVLGPGEDRGIAIYDIANNTIVYPTPVESSSVPFNRFLGFSDKEQLQQIQYVQYGGAIFFAHRDVVPFAIQKQFSSVNTFSLVPFWFYSELGENLGAEFPTDAEIALAWPYTSRNSTTITVQIDTASVGTGRTLTASSPIFNSEHVGSLIRVTNGAGSITGVAVFTAFVSSTVMTVRVLKAFGDTSTSTNWAFSSWSVYRGWPASITFFENRLIYGGNYAEPTIWGSRSGNLADLRQEHYIDDSPNTVTNDDPFSFTPASTEPNEIIWLAAAKTLTIGTYGREYIAFGPDQSLSFGPLNFTFQAQSAVGSSYVKPVRREDSLLFVQRSGRSLREFVYNFQEDAYKSVDIMLFGEHMINRMRDESDVYNVPASIVEIAQQVVDNPITWVVDSFGGLFAATRNRDLEINAFHFHKLGGISHADAGMTLETPAKILSVCVAPSPDGTHDDLYLAVERTIDGERRIYLERINREFDARTVENNSASILNKIHYVDCAKLSRLGSPSVTHSGFGHLVGEELDVVADGEWLGTFTVNNSGQIVLDDPALEVIAGYGYRALLKTTNINMGSVIGSSQGTTKSIDTITLRFNKTIGAKYGTSLDSLDEIEFRDFTLNMDDPIEMFTGDRELGATEGWSNKLHVYVVQDLPLPLHVDALIVRGLTND